MSKSPTQPLGQDISKEAHQKDLDESVFASNTTTTSASDQDHKPKQGKRQGQQKQQQAGGKPNKSPSAPSNQQHQTNGRRRNNKKGPREPQRPMVILPAGVDMMNKPVAILGAKRIDTSAIAIAGKGKELSPGNSASRSGAGKKQSKSPASGKQQDRNSAGSKSPSARAPLASPSKPPTPKEKSRWAHELVDARFGFAASSASLPSHLWHASNNKYRVVGVLGTQSSGKSALLNALATSSLTSNPAQNEVPFVEKDFEDRHGILHQTRGIQSSFCTIGGERVLLLDTQPVLSPSILYDLIERQANLNLCSSHASLATLHDLQLAVFLLSVCDAVLVVEDDNVRARGLWKLLRFAYLSKTGDAIKDKVADLVLVRNFMSTARLECAETLGKEQDAWISFFTDLIPYAASHPKLYFCPLGLYGKSIDSTASEVDFIKHVLMYEVFDADGSASTGRAGAWLDHSRATDSAWWPSVALPDDYNTDGHDSMTEEESDSDSDTDDGIENDSGCNAVCPSAGDSFAHLHTLLAYRRAHPIFKLIASSNASARSTCTDRISESDWVDLASRLWMREIPHSIPLREFAVVCDGLLLST